MTTRAELREALKHPNVRAFLHLIREGETNQDDSAYRMHFGGAYFSSFADHPRKAITVGDLTSTAAGAYQFLARTWDGLVKQYGFEDFGPQCQDEGAVALIAGRKALNCLVDGNLADALDRCSWEWASLPPPRYGQHTLTAERAYATYEKYGGRFVPVDAEGKETAAAVAPIAAAPAVKPTQEGPKMPAAPLIIAAAQMLLPFVSDLFRGHGSKTATRNADLLEKAGPAIVEIAKTVTGVQTAEEAVAKIESDPSTATAFRRAVELDVDRLVGLIERTTEIDDASRDKATERAAKDRVDLAPRMAEQQFWIVVGVGIVLGALAVVDVAKDGAMSEGVMALLAAFVTWAMQKRGTIVDYRFGSSAGSAAKDEIIAASRK
jgi:muramidase (phage lysozyme)